MKYNNSQIINALIDHYCKRFASVAQLCRHYGIGRPSFYHYLAAHQRDQLFKPKKRGRKTIITNEVVRFIEATVATDACITIKEVCQSCTRKGFKVSESTVYKVMHTILKLRFKKRKLVVLPNSYGKEEHKEAIRTKQSVLRSIGIDDVVSIDESGFYLEMFTLRGWCKRGTELKTTKTKMRLWKYTVTLAISAHGIIAQDIRLGSMNSNSFIEFLKTKVIPNASDYGYLLMDNVSLHKTNRCKEYIKEAGKQQLFTVPYSPDLNPVENVFSSLKRLTRKCCPKEESELYRCIKKGLDNQKQASLKAMYERSFGIE